MPYVPKHKMPAEIYRTVIRVSGCTHKLLSLGHGMTSEDQKDEVRKEAQRMFGQHAEIGEPVIWNG